MVRGVRVLGWLLLAGLLACDDAHVPVSPNPSPPLLSILDGAQGGGNEHFFFLPPMLPQPSYSGEFDAALSPVVQICEWTGTGCASPLVAEFTITTGPGSETVRVVPEDEHYFVNWHTRRLNLDPAKTYRIRVLVAGTELGHADVDVVSSARDAGVVDRNQFVPLINGRTLPISARLTREWLDDLESLLIFGLQPPLNDSKRKSRGATRPGTVVVCTGDWPLASTRFVDRG